MAIDYYVDIGTKWSLPVVAEEFISGAQSAGILAKSATVDDVLNGTATTLDAYIRLREEPERKMRQPWDPVCENFHFRPNLIFSYRLGKNAETTRQQTDLLKTVLHVIDRVPADLVLHREIESVWLVWHDNTLTVNDSDDIWTPDRLALLRRPYTRVPLDFE